MTRKRKRRTRRVQYFPELVATKVLNNDFLRTLTHLIYSSKLPVSAGKLARELTKLLGKNYTPAYISSYLRKLEKWGVVRPYRDPSNGHLLWWPADTKTAELLKEELGKQEMKKVLQVVEAEEDSWDWL